MMIQRCGLPLCSSCQSLSASQVSAHTPECSILQQNSVKHQPNTVSSAKLLLNTVTILRLLLKGGWEELESHMEKRRGGKQWMMVEKQVMPVLSQLRDNNDNILFSEVIILSRLCY